VPAGRGDEFTLALVGRERFAAMADTLRFVSQPGQASDLVRQGLTRTPQLGLVPFVARTPTVGRHRRRRGADDEKDETDDELDPLRVAHPSSPPTERSAQDDDEEVVRPGARSRARPRSDPRPSAWIRGSPP